MEKGCQASLLDPTEERTRSFARLALLSDQPDDLQARLGEDDQDVAARVGLPLAELD